VTPVIVSLREFVSLLSKMSSGIYVGIERTVHCDSCHCDLRAFVSLLPTVSSIVCVRSLVDAAVIESLVRVR
jgi:hypothetical protein